MLATRTDLRNDEQATTAWADETTLFSCLLSVSRLPWWSQWRMTPTTATKVDLSKEHIPTIISFPHGSRTSFIQAGKQRNWFFVETAWSLVFLFPHLLYFCFVVFPRQLSTYEKRRKWNCLESLEKTKIVYEFEMANNLSDFFFPFVLFISLISFYSYLISLLFLSGTGNHG